MLDMPNVVYVSAAGYGASARTDGGALDHGAHSSEGGYVLHRRGTRELGNVLVDRPELLHPVAR